MKCIKKSSQNASLYRHPPINPLLLAINKKVLLQLNFIHFSVQVTLQFELLTLQPSYPKQTKHIRHLPHHVA